MGLKERKIRNLISSLIWLIVGVVFVLRALDYGVFVAGTPGSGFFPLVCGLGLILLCIILLGIVLFSKKEDGKGVRAFFPESDSWKRLLIVLAALVFFVVFVDSLGFFVSTFIFMVILLRIGPKSWAASLCVALLATGLSYLLFDVLLKVQLPRGVLGI